MEYGQYLRVIMELSRNEKAIRLNLTDDTIIIHGKKQSKKPQSVSGIKAQK